MTRGWEDLTSGRHPGAGLIAAHAERRLGRDEAEQMNEHIARCAACAEVFAETARFLLDEESEVAPWPSRGLSAFFRVAPVRLAAGLAVTVALVLAIHLVSRARSERAQPSLVADLAEAMGRRRFVEPRVTGGFQYGRLAVLRSGETPPGLDAHSPAVLAAVARIRARAESDSSAEAQGALGITYLVSGDLGLALEALEQAAALDPSNPRRQSDLAAARLVRASRLDEPAELPKALEAAEAAITLKDPPDEAYFNRALALEALHLVDAARKAWEDYLKRDSTSGWASEAKSHLDRLRPGRLSSVEEDRDRVQAAIRQGRAAVDHLARESPSLLRDAFHNELLPAWAEACLAGHADAKGLRDQAELLGEALLRATGDALPRDTARALVEPAPSASVASLHAQARGLRALHEAQRLYDGGEPSCDLNGEALRDLEAGGSPRAVWARLQVVITCLFPAERRAAAAELASLEALAGKRHFLHLLGRVYSMQGLILAEGGELSAALARYALARDTFAGIREPEGEARGLGLSAQGLRLLGDSRGAWRERLRALALLSGVRNARNRHAILDEAFEACLAEETPRSGLHFESALVASALRWSAPVAASEALLRRAALHHALGDETAACADLDASRRWMGRVSDIRLRSRLAAQAEATRGDILARSEPEAAVRSLRGSLAHFRRTAPQLLPSLELRLARALLRQGRGGEAEHELLAGIAELEGQRTSLRDLALQVSFFDQGLPLFDDMVRLQVEQGERVRGLAFVERGRSRQLVDALGSGLGPADAHHGEVTTTPLEPPALQREIQDGVALLYYAALEERLFMWALLRDRSLFAERPRSAAELRRLVARHQAAMGQPSPDAARVTGALLYDELVRPLLPALASTRVLIVVPDGALQALSFASLVDRQSGRYLVEDHSLGVAPSGTVFVRASAAATARRRGERVLVVGNPRLDPRARIGLPDLPGAEAEAAEIATLFEGAELLTGSRATKGAFLAGIRASQVVHFAGHALAGTDGSGARLFLASDGSSGEPGVLRPGDLLSSRAPRTRVVVLAACRTAAGAVSPTEGALSLGRPFLAAGVPDVVASLWDIDDVISRRFFVAFHREMRASGEPMVALRRAQLALLRDRDPAHAHPASWAPFVCMGGLGRRTDASDPPPPRP